MQFKQIFYKHARTLAIKSSLTSSIRYPLQPSLHNNLNANTINFPLVKSFIRHNSSKPQKPSLLPEQIKEKALETLEKSPATELSTQDSRGTKKSIWEKSSMRQSIMGRYKIVGIRSQSVNEVIAQIDGRL